MEDGWGNEQSYGLNPSDAAFLTLDGMAHLLRTEASPAASQKLCLGPITQMTLHAGWMGQCAELWAEP